MSNDWITIAVAEDQPLLLRGCRTPLESKRIFGVVGRYKDGNTHKGSANLSPL